MAVGTDMGPGGAQGDHSPRWMPNTHPVGSDEATLSVYALHDLDDSWDARSEKWDRPTDHNTAPVRLRGHVGTIVCCALFTDGNGRTRAVSGATDDTLRIWDIDDEP